MKKHKLRNTYTTRRGFSFIELLVVIAIMVVIAAVIVFSLGSFRQQQVLRNSVDIIASYLTEARSRTLAARNESQHGIEISSSGIMFFEGTDAASGTALKTETFDTLVTVTWSLGGGDEVVFDRLSGKAGAYGTITVELVADASKTGTVTVDQTGIVQITE